MKNKILFLIAFIILASIIVVAIWGFNVDMCYKNHHIININIGQEYNLKDIKVITDEVFGKEKIEIQKAGIYKDFLTIKVTEVSNEQKELLNTKINEKYGISNSVDDIEVHYIPSFRLLDIVKPYIIPVIISSVLVLAYMSIKFRKIGVTKVITQTIILSFIAEIIYISIIALTRYSIDRLVMPTAIVIYMAVLTVISNNFEKQLNVKK